ncbi:ORF20A [Fowl aviadenovirus E]|uniref:ORF20A n=1 Tax=Fowl aviadenovirus E TaxID=190065 RepID=A0A650C001_9ADEN|nr:ORF20A [Fowl aviadenovirus E]QGQ62920.1 ORF20A [Fowl aviadenovirus E]
MPLCSDSVRIRRRRREACLLLLLAVTVGLIHCGAVAASYLFLSQYLHAVPYVFMMFACCTLLATIAFVLLIVQWRRIIAGGPQEHPRTPLRIRRRCPALPPPLPNNRRFSWLRSLSHFPARSPNWTVSSNPFYDSRSDTRSPPPSVPPPPTPLELSLLRAPPAGSDEEEVYGGSAEHVYTEIDREESQV